MIWLTHTGTMEHFSKGGVGLGEGGWGLVLTNDLK